MNEHSEAIDQSNVEENVKTPLVALKYLGDPDSSLIWLI